MSQQKYKFKVEGIVPPRNVRRKGKSMWNDPTEVLRLIEFRKKACAALDGSVPLSENIALSINIHLPQNYTGDLDNYIKGICDGLSVIKSIDNPNYGIHPDFEKQEHEDIHPRTFAMIKDDGEIIKITATKTLEDIEEPFYEVTIEGK